MAPRKGKPTIGPDPHFPGGARNFSTEGPEAKKYLWAGRIVHVDPETMVCSVAFDSGYGERHDVPLPAPGGSGPRSFSGSILEPGTRVLIGWRKYGNRGHVPLIVEILPVGIYPAREFEPYTSVDPAEVAEILEQDPELEFDPHFFINPIRLKLKKAYPGDVLHQSSGGADALFDRDATLSNRHGNEIRLRDSDQTKVVQVLNEFTSNASGYYKRGLIRRDAFTFLQDLFPLSDLTNVDAPYDISQEELFNQTIPTDSPAYNILRQFGLIDESGKRVFGTDQGINEYPYVVHPDGQRANYIVQGENDNSFSTWPYAYVEDRSELRHVSNGVMNVTDDGDGFQIDLEKELYIEDVKGTVVGNDPVTDAGRVLYKRIMTMKVFTDPDQGQPSDGPIFEAVDMVNELDLVDSIALARLFKIQSPNSSNQYAFGITKEGKVLLHVPATQVGGTQRSGKSVEANFMGLVKTIIGKDPNTQLSLDSKFSGGINLEVGRGPNNNSIEMVLHGPVKTRIINDDDTGATPAEESVVGGSVSKSVTGSSFVYVQGSNVKISGALDATEADSIQHNAGTGGYKFQSAGDVGRTVLGKTTEQFAQLYNSLYALGSNRISLAGIDSNTMLAGSILRTVVSGAGIVDTVTAGNLVSTVVAGNMLMSVATGNMAATVGAGNLSMSAAAGVVSISSAISVTINAGVNTSINSPTTKIGAIIVGNAVAGVPGPPSPHFDYITGLPILGVPTVTLGLCMPINPVTVTPFFKVDLLASGLVGISSNQLASGLANGISIYASTTLKVSVLNVGTAGTGKGTGIALLTSLTIYPFMAKSFVSYGINGIMSQPLALAVSNGLSKAISIGIVNTSSPNVGVGTGVGKLVAGGGIPAFIKGFKSAGMNGIQTEQLATAIGTGFDLSLNSSVVNVAIAGSPSIIPSTGPGFGKISLRYCLTMALNTNGALLEGVRISNSSNPYVYPPRDFVNDSSVFNSLTSRAEYCLIISGQDSSSDGIEIADDSLKFLWTRNDSIFRFNYDSFTNKWFPSPGSTPSLLGKLSNSPRLTAPIPQSDLVNAPYQIYLNLPRITTFTFVLVTDSSSFTDPPAGTVEISRATGELNFSSSDISNPSYQNSLVYCSRQNFFDRTKNDGSIGSFPNSVTSYDLYLNPIPGSTQNPLIRIGYRRYLEAVSYPNETSMPLPSSPGIVHFALDTGKILISDISDFLGETIYYDGVTLGTVSLTKTFVNLISPGTGAVLVGDEPFLIGETDSSRYVCFAESSSPRYYLTTIISDTIPTIVATGTAVIVNSTGQIFISSSDSFTLNGRNFGFVDTYLPIESGVTFQVYRSGINGPGPNIVPDFVELYKFSNQLLNDGIQQSPYQMLPVVPIQDSDLSFKIEQGTGGGGSFVGSLIDSSNPLISGFGYNLNLSNKRIEFARRYTYNITLDQSASSVKLTDASIFQNGFELSINSVPAVIGTDFNFDPVGGTIDFLNPVGEGNPLNVYDFSGTTTLPNTFKATTNVFVPEHVGSYLFIKSGVNAGFYRINQYVDPNEIIVDSEFVNSSSSEADIRQNYDVVADRFWFTVSPPMKQFKLETSDSESGPFTTISQDKFTLVPQVGQINLTDLTIPNKLYRASYVFLDSSDEGVTIVPTNKTEFIPSKVRLDTATYVSGTNVITFNTSNKTILPSFGITVTVNGVRLEPDKVQYQAPNSAVIGVTLTTEQVLVDYSVAESVGGSKTMDLPNSPVVADYPQFISGSSSVVLNGDQTKYIKFNSSVFVDNKDVYLVSSSVYDSSSDNTFISFYTSIVNDFTGSFLSCEPIDFIQYGVSPEVIPQDSNSVTISGQPPISVGSIVKLDSDPYYVIATSYNNITNKTTLTISTGAKKNYITSVLSYSVSKILSPGTDFTTSFNADLRQPFTLFLGGTNPRILIKDIDYSVADGGQINLKTPTSFGSYLIATYVARLDKPVGTVFSLNYAYMISPNESNGISNQQIFWTYNLYAPDSFFYRIETVTSYIPEVAETIKQDAVSQSPSGPISNPVSSLKNKDFGIPSLYFDEQRYSNLDYVSQVLLKYYNDTINLYEDLLSGFDGRVVGGTSGKFRYDMNLNNPPRNSYSEVTNDVDDRVKIYDTFQLSGFFNFVVTPVYASMWQSNSISRIFPTVKKTNFALNDKTNFIDNGSVIGNVGVTNITGLSTIVNASATSYFKTANGTQLVIEQNGDAQSLNPSFSSGQKVHIYKLDGSFSQTVTITSITGSGPFFVNIFPPISFKEGSMAVDVMDDSISSNKFYFPNVDIGFNPQNGNLLNISLQFLISLNFQREVTGNSIMSSNISYQNVDTAPSRPPVLDGLDLNDYGFESIPRLKRESELSLMEAEIDFLNDPSVGYGSVNADLVTVVGSNLPPVSLGDALTFIGGPNDGLNFTVAAINSTTSIIVTPPLLQQTITENELVNVTTSANKINYPLVLDRMLFVLNDSVESNPVAPALIGNIDSEILTLSHLSESIGTQIFSGNGVASGNILTDTGANFSGLLNAFVFVQSGNNFGLYKVSSFTSNTITVSVDLPYTQFPSSGVTNYVVLNRYNFLSDAGPDFIAESLRNTLAFYNNTLTWRYNINPSGVLARKNSVSTRIQDVNKFIDQCEQVLQSGDSFYEKRYLWISQRTDRKTGFLVRKSQAQTQRAEATVKLIQDQKKILALSNLLKLNGLMGPI